VKTSSCANFDNHDMQTLQSSDTDMDESIIIGLKLDEGAR